MESPRTVNTGGLPFREIRRRGKFYVDKSMLIADILDMDDSGVYLFTRPRRFGKSTNISMLDAFFNIRYRGNDWFTGLAISDHPEYDPYRNAYPVIYIDMKELAASDFESFISGFRDMLRLAFDPFDHLLESEVLRSDQKDELASVFNKTMPKDDMCFCVRDLCLMLERHQGSKTIVLIDEYDRAVTDSFGDELQEQIIEFLGRFMSATLKSNDSLQMAYVTGVMQVAKAGMFSGVNNLSINNVFSKESDERFGFTESEVRWILDQFGHPEGFGEVREWYDGYRFGDAEVYNPFSVMTYVQKGFSTGNYWINSGKDEALRWLLERVDMASIGTVANIVNGGSSECELHDSMTYDELRLANPTDLYSLMVMTGYLKAEPSVDGKYLISLPNTEVRAIVDRLLNANMRLSSEIFTTFNRALLDGDAGVMAESMQRILVDASYYVLRDEISYETILLTIMHGILGGYSVKAERESGNGRADLILTPKRDGVVPIIMELKVCGSEEGLDDEARGAIAQIHDRKYYLGMSGDVVLVGLAFWGKVPRAVTETVSL